MDLDAETPNPAPSPQSSDTYQDYVGQCREQGVEPNRRVLDGLAAAQSEEEAQNVLREADDEQLAESISQSRRTGTGASGARMAYLGRMASRGLRASPHHLARLEAATREPGEQAGAVLEDIWNNLRRLR